MAKKDKIKVTRHSDGDTKEVLKSEVRKYNALGYKAEWQGAIEVKAEVKEEISEEEKADRKAKRQAARKAKEE